jgi:hypothetical protein
MGCVHAPQRQGEAATAGQPGADGGGRVAEPERDAQPQGRCRDAEGGPRPPGEVAGTATPVCVAHPVRCVFAPFAVPFLFGVGVLWPPAENDWKRYLREDDAQPAAQVQLPACGAPQPDAVDPVPPR